MVRCISRRWLLPAAIVVLRFGMVVMSPHDMSVLWDRAKNEFLDGNYVKAEKTFSRLARELPMLKEVYYNLARTQCNLHKLDQCFATLRKGMAMFPDDGRMQLELCKSVCRMLNDRGRVQKRNVDTSELIRVCSVAADLMPDDPEPLHQLGSALTLLGLFDSAADILERWIAIFETKLHPIIISQGKSNLALTLLRGGKYKRAWELVQEVMELDSRHEATNAAANVRSVGWPLDRRAWELCLLGLEQFVKEMTVREPRVCKSGKWKLGLNWTEEAIKKPNRIQVTTLNPETAFMTSYGRHDDPQFTGRPLPKYPRFYHERNIHLVSLKKAFMSGHSGIIHFDCVMYTGGHHVNLDIQNFPREKMVWLTLDDEMTEHDHAVTIIDIDVRVASIIQHQLMNYYHFLLEGLPKLLYLMEHVLSKPENADVHLLLPTPDARTKFIDDTLALPEFKSIQNRIIRYPAEASLIRLHFRRGVFVVDWIHRRHDVHGSLARNSWGVYSPPRAAILKARSFFHDILQRKGKLTKRAPGDHNGEIIYVSRPAGNIVRSFPNEDAFVAFLKKRFGSRVRVHFGTEKLLDQIGMFSNASVVLGAHGAGLANFAFTQPGASLVMIPMDPMVEFCFGHLVAALGERHVVLSDIPGSYYYGSYGTITAAQMNIAADAVQSMLDARSSPPRRDEL